ncbi:MAG: CPBP family intramembrane metalloprotease [Clostridia bacterium]|nr:CPBP family intramembrane metalloprotease [Clostridia bacterium]
MSNRKRITAIVTVVVFACIILAIIDGIIQPRYLLKSGMKLILFLVIPFIYSLFDKKICLRELFKINKRGMKTALMLCIPVFVIILVSYWLLKDVFDFSGVTKALTNNIGVNSDNFVIVSIYISFVNSFVEEFFFRGFAFLSLKRITSGKTASIFSAVMFSLYHIAIMTGWFSVGVFVITLAGLFIGGLIFNYLNSRSDNIYTSWFVHMFANFAINTIGFMLFGII